MKIFLKKTASYFRLIPLIDYFRSRWRGYKNTHINREFIRFHPSFILPPLELAYDAYGHVDWNFYYTSGLEDARNFSQLISKYSKYHSKQDLHILDWGCGPARVLRHMPQFLGPNCHYYGTDNNPSSIKWCKENFKAFHFDQNGLKPPLNFTDESFDVIYGLSILTHLSKKSHFEWIAELKRLLKPNGILVLTTHGDYFKKDLTEQEKVLYDNDQLVIRDHITEGRRGFAAFHPPKFLRENLFHQFNILDHLKEVKEVHLKQDTWVIRKT